MLLSPAAVGRNRNHHVVATSGMATAQQYEQAAYGIANYLAERQQADGSFPGPDNYGLAFSLWLWSHFGAQFGEQLGRAWERLKGNVPASHGEFNVYALLQCREQLGPGPVDALMRRVRLGRRHSANWMLLRAACRIRPGPFCSPARASWEARAALLRYARRGLIADRSGVRSLAYHSFCGALLADLWRDTGLRWAGRAAAQAAQFIANFILPNGDSLYVGRGQQQIFGYGALIYLLEAAAEITGREEFSRLSDSVFQFLLRFQRPDGSFPLVLREEEPPEPWLPDVSHPGWYTYNRYADYLPFLGCFLLKAAAPETRRLEASLPAAAHPEFRVWRQKRYVAVLAVPGGAPTNDLAFPYVCVDGQSLFPCYGTESEAAERGAGPLPYGALADGRHYGFRSQLRYRLTESGLVGVSSLVRHRRLFEFRADGFVCRDEIAFRRRCVFSRFTAGNFLFRTLRRLPEGGFETWHRGARAVLNLNPEGTLRPNAAVSASGPLIALSCPQGRLEAKAGHTIATELRVRFA